MSVDKPKYDAAISFLSKDERTARAIHDKLSEGLSVFFFPRSQEDLAGKDGLEAMRTPFFSDSRLVVVLYREGWGGTPWTRVEQTAVQEGCLEYGWERLCFVVLDKASKLPVWLPQTHVRFNFEEYGLEQLVGAIKARIQERGGQFTPLTPSRVVERLKEEEAFRDDRARMMNSQDGVDAVAGSLSSLFEHIEMHCKEINAAEFPVRYSSNVQSGSLSTCVITDGSVSLGIVWEQRYRNILEGGLLLVREYNGAVQSRPTAYFVQPELLEEEQYVPDLSFARECGWKKQGEEGFLGSPMLAEECVMRFLKLVGRFSRGEIKRNWP